MAYSLSIAESRVEGVKKACALADDLAASAKNIPELVEDFDMNEADRRAFESLAFTLEFQAERLNEVSAKGDFAGSRHMMGEIWETCNSCHTRFGDVAGPLINPQVGS